MIFCGKLKIQKRVEALQSLQKSKSTELPSTIPDGRYEMPVTYRLSGSIHKGRTWVTLFGKSHSASTLKRIYSKKE
jgi:hypothetical protein